MNDAPERIWIPLEADLSILAVQDSKHEELSYILDTPEALAKAPAVIALVKAAVEAERERCAGIVDRKHGEYMIGKGRNPADYASEFSFLAAAIREVTP